LAGNGFVTRPSARIVFVAPNPSVDRVHEVSSIELGAIHRPGSVVVVPGGKGLNAARAAATLGGDVVAIALVGGHAGAWIAEHLAELGVEARLVDGGAETRTCLSVLDRSTGRLTEFYESGLPVASGSFEALEQAVRRELDAGDVRWLALSGSLPPGLPVDGHARLTSLAGARGIRTIVDTHGEALRLALGARPTVVKVNAAEAGEFVDGELIDAMAGAAATVAMRSAGAGGVVVTLGRDGAVVSGDDGPLHLTSSAEAGPFVVGSGDAFLGGLAVALARGATLLGAARSGMAAAVANTRLPGQAILDPGVAAGLAASIEVDPV
jgi:1-phosphofructokinase family hexose kinase